MDAGAVAAQEGLLQATGIEHDPADMLALPGAGLDRGGQRLVGKLDRQIAFPDEGLRGCGSRTWEQKRQCESDRPGRKGSTQTHDDSSLRGAPVEQPGR